MSFSSERRSLSSRKISALEPSQRSQLLISEDLRDLIGQTPLVKANKLFPKHNVFLKLEGANPLGSIKDRLGFGLIDKAIADQKINIDTRIVESTSGNLGIGLAAACQYYGLQFTAVVDPKISPINRKLLELYGANIEFVDQPDENGSLLGARIKKVKYLLNTYLNSYWPCQYHSPNNTQIHFDWTAGEILEQLSDSTIDYVVASVSTTGTLSGITKRLRTVHPNLEAIAVDEIGSSLFERPAGKRYLNGMGAGIPNPGLSKIAMAENLFNQVVEVNLPMAVKGCYDLLKYVGILAGGTSGAAIAGLKQHLTQIPEGSVIVVILPDRGERYLDTIYNPEWVEARTQQLS